MNSSIAGFADRLAPGMAEYLTRYDAMFAHNATDLTVEDQRRMFRELCQAFAGPRPEGLSVRDATVPGDGRDVPVRIYDGDVEKLKASLHRIQRVSHLIVAAITAAEPS